MADVRKYMRLTGTLVLETDKGNVTFSLVGGKPPDEMKKLGDYVKLLVDEVASGSTAGEAHQLKEQISKLEAKIAEQAAQLSAAKEVEAPKVSRKALA